MGADARDSIEAPARRRLRPPRLLRPTRAGWCFFALIFGVGFAALNTGNNLLYLVLSLMLAFLVLSGVLSESALRGIRIKRALPREAYAGVANHVRLQIHNAHTRVASFAIVVEDRYDCDGETRSAGRCFALRVGPGETVTRAYELWPEHRGHLTLTGHSVSTRFPFGLFVKSLRAEASARLLVYPEIEPVPWQARSGAATNEGEASVSRRGHGAEMSGLRDFVSGDPASRIHWRSSLRRDALLVGETDDEQEAEVEVLLRTRVPGGSSEREFEARVRRAASEVARHLEDGLRVGLRTDDTRIAPGSGVAQRARLLGFLALVEPSLEAPQSAWGSSDAPQRAGIGS